MVLLIDEIDKADIEFPNDLLLELDRMQFFVYETRKTVVAKHRPVVIITSNNEKELPDAFLRRCFFHYIRFPDRETMEKIVQAHYPDIKHELAREALNVFFQVRGVTELKKKPATSELLDWLKLLMIEDLPPEVLRSQDAEDRHPAAVWRAAEERAGRAPVRAAGLPDRGSRAGKRGRGHLAPSTRPQKKVRGFRGRIPLPDLPRDPRCSPSSSSPCAAPASRPASPNTSPCCSGMKEGVADYNVDDFYHLSRATLVKDERHLDRFDRVFGEVFKGLEPPEGDPKQQTPEEWLRKLTEKLLTEEEKAAIEAAGGFDALMELLKQRLAEQKGRHQGGSKWIGTGGTSPFGAHGYNPEGVRIGQEESRNRRAVKVWDKREFQDLDGDIEIGTRNMKLALRRLRRFARQGAATELDLPDTIRATANNAGTLDLKMVPERHNTVKVLLFLDIGGSMDDHIRVCAELFSACRAEFKHLEHYYFHNCPYERLWTNNRRRKESEVSTFEVLRKYGPDYKAIFVGDGAMSPYEIIQPGGSVEHWNEETGQVWLDRMTGHFRRTAWLNPMPEWPGRATSRADPAQLMEQRMFPLTLGGIDAMTRELSR